MAEAETKSRNPMGLLLLIVLIVAAILFFAPFGLGVSIFRMPSGSMHPTIAAGDHFVTAKWAYGYGRYSSPLVSMIAPNGGLFDAAPQRGDLAVFRTEADPNRDNVKRVVGLPGDRIQMVGGVLHINGEAVARTHEGEGENGVSYRETLPGGVSYFTRDGGEGDLDNTAEVVVPEGRYFLLGDDRDNSADSRVPEIGMIPRENFVGRVIYVRRAVE